MTGCSVAQGVVQRFLHGRAMARRHDQTEGGCQCVACSRSSSGLWLGITGCAALMVLAVALGIA